MAETKEPIWVYEVTFQINTMHTQETVKAFGTDMIQKVLEAKYPNCTIKVEKVKVIRRELQK